MRLYLKKYYPLFILTGLFFGLWITDFLDYFTLENIKEQRLVLLGHVQSSPIISAFIFCIVYIASVSLSLPIASLLTLIGGFLFGFIPGTFLVVSSATAGATLLFFIAQSTVGRHLRDKAKGFYNKVAKNMEGNAIQYMLFMRFVPVVPFFIANILPALFKVKPRHYILTTFFGILPGTAVYVNIGRGLGEIETLNDLISPNILIAFSLLGLLSLMPTFIKLGKTLWMSKTS